MFIIKAISGVSVSFLTVYFSVDSIWRFTMTKTFIFLYLFLTKSCLFHFWFSGFIVYEWNFYYCFVWKKDFNRICCFLKSRENEREMTRKISWWNKICFSRKFFDIFWLFIVFMNEMPKNRKWNFLNGLVVYMMRGIIKKFYWVSLLKKRVYLLQRRNILATYLR